MFGRIVEGVGLALELLSWAGTGVRALRDQRAEKRRRAKAAKRSAQREADLLERFVKK